MKCPACGHWNKPSFPRCFKCGMPLLKNEAATPAWRENLSEPSSKKMHIVYDDSMPQEENIKTVMPLAENETLAAEMTRLKERRSRPECFEIS